MGFPTSGRHNHVLFRKFDGFEMSNLVFIQKKRFKCRIVYIVYDSEPQGRLKSFVRLL